MKGQLHFGKPKKNSFFFGFSLNLHYLCSREREKEKKYGLMVAIGSVCANASVVVASHSQFLSISRRKLQRMRSAQLSRPSGPTDTVAGQLSAVSVSDIANGSGCLPRSRNLIHYHCQADTCPMPRTHLQAGLGRHRHTRPTRLPFFTLNTKH